MSFSQRVVKKALEFTASADDLRATRIFLLDALGTGLSGTHISYAPVLAAQALAWHGEGVARVIGSEQRLSRDGAALVNGYLIHNQEYDCVHEGAIVHPMGVILGVLLAHGDVEGLSGAQLLDGVAVGVEVATTVGLVARTPLKFYRQGMASALGATAALSRLKGFDVGDLTSAMGLCYSQLSGTMQAHAEGSPMLPMQMGFNARAVLNAVDLAAAGVPGPVEFLDGRYGYLNLMEVSWNDADAEAALAGGHWIQQLSHKPFPTGRATHAVVDALDELRTQHDLDPREVARIDVDGPPLVVQLGGRPVHQAMAPNYARLCLGYVAATALLKGGVTPQDFLADALTDPLRLNLAQKLHLSEDGNSDKNALAPVTVRVALENGQQFTSTVATMRGHPNSPLDRMAYLQKFKLGVTSAESPLDEQRMNTLVETVENLGDLEDTRMLTQLLGP
jgi:aconitate decarboxylase